VKHFLAAAALAAVLACSPAEAQTVGGSVSINATTSSANAALPVSTQAYPAVLLEYGVGAASNEIWYALGVGNTTAASTTQPGGPNAGALPSVGLCLSVGGGVNFVAAITGTATATLRVTQLTTCPP